MMEKNSKLVFEDRSCMIYDKNNANRLVTIIKMKKKKLFPLNFPIGE